MAISIGIVRQISGTVVAIDANGNERPLSVGDEIFEGENVKAIGAASEASLSMNNGETITITTDASLEAIQSQNFNNISADTELAALQQAILQGQTLDELEATAAGASASRGSSLGTAQLNPSYFTDGGHYSNVNATIRNLDANTPNQNANFTYIGSSDMPLDTTPPNAPRVEFLEDINNDGFINASEFSSNLTRVKISPDDTANVGDTLNITIIKPDNTTEIRQVTITQTIIDNGLILNDIPIQDGKDTIVRATITDQAGNQSAPGDDQVSTDTTLPVVSITLDQISTDGYINKTEATNPVTISGKVGGDAKVGDTVVITLPNGTTQNAVVVDNGGVLEFSINVPATTFTEGSLENVKATITIYDEAGNPASAQDDKNVTLDTTIGTPSVVFVEDTLPNVNSQFDNDKKLNFYENNNDGDQTQTPIRVTIPTDGSVSAGDILTISVTTDNVVTSQYQVSITQTMIDNGFYNDKISIQHDKTYGVSVKITDAAGNESESIPGVTNDEITTDLVGPSAPEIIFSEDANQDKRLNIAENSSDSDNAATQVLVKVQGDIKVGDTLKVTITNPDGSIDDKTTIVTQDIIDNGYKIDGVKVEHDKRTSAVAQIIDQAGNESTVANNHVDVDLVKPEVTIKLDDIARDNIINSEEAKRDITISGEVGGDAKAGDEVSIKFDGTNEVKTTVKEVGGKLIFSVDVPSSSFKEDQVSGDITTKVTAHITISDAAGNTASDDDAKDVDKNTTLPPTPIVTFTDDADNDGKLSYDENLSNGNQNITPVTIEIPTAQKDKIEVGEDKLVITIRNPDGTQTSQNVTITQDILDNGYTIANVPVKNSQTSTVSAHVESKIGSLSNEAADSVTALIAPVVTFEGNDDGNGVLSVAENLKDSDLTTTTAKIALNISNAAAGDTIELTWTGSDGIKHTNAVMLSQTDVNNGYVLLKNIKTLAGKAITVEAGEIKDGATGAAKSNPAQTATITPETTQTKIEFDTVTETGQKNSESLTRAQSVKDGDVNRTTAKLDITNEVKNGDIVEVEIKLSNGTTQTRQYEVQMNTKGFIALVNVADPTDVLTAPDSNKPYEGFSLKKVPVIGGETTTISAKVIDNGGNELYGANGKTPTEPTIELEALRAPEVIFNESMGKKSVNRIEAQSDHDMYSTDVTIKIPKNIVTGDTLSVVIYKPIVDDGSTTPVVDKTLTYNIEKDQNTGIVTLKDSSGTIVPLTDNSKFTISNVQMGVGQKTQIEATITDKDQTDSASATNYNTISALYDMSINFDEDTNQNIILSRNEANIDGELYETTASLTIPRNAVNGDRLNIEIKDNNGTIKTGNFTINIDSNNNVTLTKISGTIDQNDVNPDPNDTYIIKVAGVPVKPSMDAADNTTIVAEVTDIKGESKAQAQNATRVTELYKDMMVMFDEDTNLNGYLSSSELQIDPVTGMATATASITISSNAVAGDIVRVDIKNETTNITQSKTYTLGVDISGNFILTDNANPANTLQVTNGVFKEKFSMSPGDTISLTASTNDSLQTAQTSGKITFGTGSGTALDLMFKEDIDRSGELSRQEAKIDGSSTTTAAVITIPSNSENGDKLNVTITDANGATRTLTYTINKVGGVLSLTSPAGTAVALDGNSFEINEPISGGKSIKMALEVTNSGGTPKASFSEKTLTMEKLGDDLEVTFKEDNLNRDGKLTREEAVLLDDINVTPIGVRLPSNIIEGDKLVVTAYEPTSGSTPAVRERIEYTIKKDANGNFRLDDGNGNIIPIVDNTANITNIAISPDKQTTVTAEVIDSTDGSNATKVSDTASIETLSLTDGDLSVSFAEDINDDGKMSRDEAVSDGNQNKTTVVVAVSNQVTNGDKLSVTINNTQTQEFTLYKDKKGVITAKDSNGNDVAIRDGAINFEVDMVAGVEAKVEATLSDQYGLKTITASDSATLETIEGVKDAVYSMGSGDKNGTVNLTIDIPYNSVVGDKLVAQYDSPYKDGAKLTKEIELTQDNINRGKATIEGIMVNTDTDHNANITTYVQDRGGDIGVKTTYILPISKNQSNNTVNFDEDIDTTQSRMYGGLGDDTLVINNNIDLSRVSDLDKKVHSFEKIQLDTSKPIELTINPKDVLDITDNKDTILKILGDGQDKVNLASSWKESADQSRADSGYKLYESIDQIDGNTVQIQIDDKIQTDI